VPQGLGQGRRLGLFQKEVASWKEQKAQGEVTEKAPDGGIFVFFSFNGKLTPGFNAVKPSDLEMWANEAFCASFDENQT